MLSISVTESSIVYDKLVSLFCFVFIYVPFRNSVLEIVNSLGLITAEKRSYPDGCTLSKTSLTDEILGGSFFEYLTDSDIRLTGASDLLKEYVFYPWIVL